MADVPSPERVRLGPHERRVLGVLIEKSLATPDYYPMTLKAIVAACNQRSNRDPVMTLDEDAVQHALSALQHDGFVMAVKADTGYATRWRHQLDRRLAIQVKEQALLAELLLRGVQTEGELRGNVARMRPFDDPDSFAETLVAMRRWTPQLVLRLSPEGQVRGVRHGHALYTDEEMTAVLEGGAAALPAAAPAEPSRGGTLESRLTALERRVEQLESFLRRELGASFDSPGG